MFVERGEECGREAEAVHRDGLGSGELAAADLGGVDGGALDDAAQAAVGGDVADAARDAAVLGERAVEPVANHGERRGFLSRRRERAEEAGELLKGVAAEKVVGADDGEGLADGVACAPDGVAGAPRFLAPGGRREAGGQGVDRLENEVHGDALGVLGGDLLAEGLLEVAADHEDDAAEAGLGGIVHGVVEDGFTGRADRVELLEAAVAGAHACGEDEKGGSHEVPTKTTRGAECNAGLG